MEEISFSTQGQEGQDFKMEKNIQQIIAQEVQRYIQDVYLKIFLLLETQSESSKNIKSLNETEIYVNLQEKQQNFLENNQQQNLLKDYRGQKDDCRIKQNFFIGSNPGLFYSKKSVFDEASSSSCQKLISIGKLLSVEPSQKNIVDNQINENSLEISGDTILDISTLMDVVKNNNIAEITNEQLQKDKMQDNKNEKQENQKKLVTKNSFFSHVPQNRSSNHSKHCGISFTQIKKKREFIVPVLTPQNFHNKSRINSQQYLQINDKNLTKFFIAEDRRKYVDNFGNETKSRIKNNEAEFFKSTLRQDSQENYEERIFRRSPLKKGNTFRQSTASNPNFKLNNPFEQIQYDNFGQSNSMNTKFLIKVLPSNKTKKFFNQSVSTFINHNYRPVTCRKQLRKQVKIHLNQQVGSGLKQNSNQIQQFCSKNEQLQKIVKQSLSCDDIAMKNSFKKMNQNSKKNKKLTFNKVQRQGKSIFLHQKIGKTLENISKFTQQKIFLRNNFEKMNPSQQSKLTTQASQFQSDQKQNISRITLSTKNHENKYKNLTQTELNMIKNNNIQRSVIFKKKASSKLNIVTKMGVRILPD